MTAIRLVWRGAHICNLRPSRDLSFFPSFLLSFIVCGEFMKATFHASSSSPVLSPNGYGQAPMSGSDKPMSSLISPIQTTIWGVEDFNGL
jgi:hypothetical protein